MSREPSILPTSHVIQINNTTLRLPLGKTNRIDYASFTFQLLRIRIEKRAKTRRALFLSLFLKRLKLLTYRDSYRRIADRRLKKIGKILWKDKKGNETRLLRESDHDRVGVYTILLRRTHKDVREIYIYIYTLEMQAKRETILDSFHWFFSSLYPSIFRKVSTINEITRLVVVSRPLSGTRPLDAFARSTSTNGGGRGLSSKP